MPDIKHLVLGVLIGAFSIAWVVIATIGVRRETRAYNKSLRDINEKLRQDKDQ